MTTKLKTLLTLAAVAALAQVGHSATEVDGKLKVDVGSTITTIATVTNVGTITTAIVPGAAATNLGKAEDAIAATGSVGIMPLLTRNDATTAAPSGASGDYTWQIADHLGIAYVRSDTPNRIICTTGSPLAVSTATTLTVLNGCAAPGASLSIYITDISFSASASGIAADSFPTLKYGTGGACGTGTNVIWGAFTAAAVQATAVQSFVTPIKLPANNELCWINSTAGSKLVIVTGYVAP